MWPPGPSCFDGIRTRITLKGHPIGWKTKPCCGYDAGEAVPFRPLRCRPAPRPSFHSAPIWQRAGGGVDIVFASWVRKRALQRLRVPVMKRTYRGIVPFPADVRTGSGGVDARVSASAFAGIRTRTGQFLGLSPLPVGPRKHAQAIRRDMPAQSTVDSTTRAESCTHACGGRAYCNTRHDRDHGG